MTVEHINPAALHSNSAFTQVVVAQGNNKTVYVGGQNAVTPEGEIIGKGDMGAQAAQVMTNLEAALAAGGAKLDHVIKWTVLAVHGHSPEAAFQTVMAAWGDRPNPPTITMAYVVALANPDFLLEMDAIAVVPD